MFAVEIETKPRADVDRQQVRALTKTSSDLQPSASEEHGQHCSTVALGQSLLAPSCSVLLAVLQNGEFYGCGHYKTLLGNPILEIEPTGQLFRIAFHQRISNVADIFL